MLKRALAVLLLLAVAVVALRLAVGVVAGLVSAVLWIVVVVALAGAGVWAWSTLKAAKRERAVKRSPAGGVAARPAEDPVEVEMRRITEELREQRRR